MLDIKGINPSYYTHKTRIEDDYKPVIQPQRRLNPKVQDVVKNMIVVLLDSGLFYPVSDSSWVSPIHVVPRKRNQTVVLNDNNELILSRTVTRWRVCIDYRKLNDATQKDHFPLPFIDQMLERLFGNEYYCFLDGFLGFFQILIAPEDQEKTTFTYRRIICITDECLFGLMQTHHQLFKDDNDGNFPRHVEDFMEVFMDEFLDAKPRLIRWVMLLQWFDIKIKDKKREENLAADHLSRLENPDLGTFTKEEIADKFPGEHLMILKSTPQLNEDKPWSVGYNPKNWSEKLDDALWAFRTAYKTPTRCTPFRLVYGKASAAKNRFMELNELMELRDGAYENTWIYKERTKRWHDSRLRGDKNFKVGDKVLLFNSRFKMHPGKLKSRWHGPNVIKTVYLYGTIEIIDRNEISFKVNGQRLKKYHDRHTDA
ncbi:reverse transcriptase domain-containing protein [Tanacetum coccineum]